VYTFHKYNNAVSTNKLKGSKVSLSEQQQVYKEEIARIWNNQLLALSNKEDIQWEDVDEDANDVLLQSYHSLIGDKRSARP